MQEEGQIVGYRVAPGPDRAAFDTFGFQQGDIVTAVNGLALSDASNSIKLYQMMKEATEATFDIRKRGWQRYPQRRFIQPLTGCP